MAQATGIRTRCKICRKNGLVEYECQSHKERVYEARIRIPGGKWESQTFKSMEAARIWRGDKYKEITCGTYRKITPTSFREVANNWLERQKPTISPSTATCYESALRIHIMPILGDKLITNITPEMIERVRNSVAKKSLSMRRHVNIHLRSIFKSALINRQIPEDPTVVSKRIRNKKAAQFRILTPSQIRSLLEVAKGPYKLYYKLALFCGLRASEIGGLGWDNIDFDKRTITLQKSVYWCQNDDERRMYGLPEGKNWILKGLKSPAAYRTIPLAPEIYKDLQIHKIESRENPYRLVFFTHSTGKPIYHKVVMENHFRNDIAKIDYEMRFHELRHTFCSILVSQGVDIKRIQYLMGHEDIQTTLNIYAHVMQNHQNDAKIVENLEAFVLTSCSHKGQDQVKESANEIKQSAISNPRILN